MAPQKTLKKRQGFTLIEILVVVVIIGVLSIIGVSKYTEFITQSRQRGCIGNQVTIDKTIGAWESQNSAIPQFKADNKTSIVHSITFNTAGKITASTAGGLSASPNNKLAATATNDESILRLTKDNKVFICPEYANEQGGLNQAIGKAAAQFIWGSTGAAAGVANLKGRRRGTDCVTWNGGKAVGPDGSDDTVHVE